MAEHLLEVNGLKQYFPTKTGFMKTRMLKAVDGVLGIHENDEELQIILGPGRAAAVTTIVTKLWKQDADVTTTDPAQKSRPRIGDGKELHAAIRKKNATPIKLLFKKIASIFLPLVLDS